MGLRFIDTHAHLFFEDFDKDREAVLARAQRAGVQRLLIVGTDLLTSKQALALAARQSGFYPTAGWHPHEAKNWTASTWQDFILLANDPAIVAIGEVGLDYFRNLSSKEEQMRVFAKAIELAAALKKPLIVHSREAHEDVLRLLKEAGRGAVNGVLHCFSADWAVAQRALEMGFFISFSGVVTYPKNTHLRDIVKNLPAGALLAETDCPFLPPQNHRGRRNEPAHVRYVFEAIAQSRGETLDAVCEQIWQNAGKLFRL